MALLSVCWLSCLHPCVCLGVGLRLCLSLGFCLFTLVGSLLYLLVCVCCVPGCLRACALVCDVSSKLACLFFAQPEFYSKRKQHEQKRRHANNNSCHTPAPVQKLLFVKAQSTTYNRMHKYATFCTVFCMGSPKLLPNPRHSNIFNLLRMDPLRCHCFFLQCLTIYKI